MTQAGSPASNFLSSPTTLGWRTHAIFAVPAFLSTATFDFERLGGSSLAWFWLALIAYSVTVLLIELMARPLRAGRARPAWVWALLGLMIIGLIRGALIFSLGLYMDLVPPSDLTYRLVGGPIFVVTVYLTGNAVVESYLSYRSSLSKLESEQALLANLRAGYKSDIAAATQKQKARVRELVATPIWELQKILEKAPTKEHIRNALVQLNAIANDVVRPVAHQLLDTGSITTTPSNPAARLRVIGRVDTAKALPLWFFLVMTFSVGLNSQVALLGPLPGFALVVIAVAPAMLAMILFQRALPQLAPRPLVFLIAVASAGLALGSLGGYLGILLGLTQTSAFWWQAGTYTLIAATFTSSFGLARLGWARALDRLGEAIEESKVLNSQLRRQLWLGNKALALELHGPIQSNLTALASAIASGEIPDRKKLEAFLEKINASLSRIQNSDYLDGAGFDSLVAELRELWEGTLNINVELSANARSLLEGDSGLGRCTFEVLREAATNAVKHGEATEVNFKAEVSEELLGIEILNNGTPLANPMEAAGARLLRQICHEFELENVQGGVLLRATLIPETQPA